MLHLAFKAASLCAFALCATVSHAESSPRWQASFLSGSERLAFYSTMKARPSGAEPFLEKFIRRDGLAHPPDAGPQKLSSTFNIRPLLGYDTNINGGLPGSEFSLGGLTLTVDEESTAKSGFTLGAALSGSVSYSIAPRQVARLSARTSYEYAPEHKLSKLGAIGVGCLQSHVEKWTWIDSCIGHRFVEKASKVNESYVSLGGSQMFSSRLGDHELTVRAERAFRDDYEKTKLSLGLRSATSWAGAVFLGADWGQRIDDAHTMLHGGSLSVTNRIFKKPTTLALNYQRSGGGTHFGMPRRDKTYQVMLTRPVNDLLSLSVGYQLTDSSIEFYDTDAVLVGAYLKSWSF